jgi:regulator of sigma E protease
MEAALTVLSLVVALSIVVFVHELGHLIVAKRSKVVVEEFGFGYPPRIFTFWRSAGKIIIDGTEILIPRSYKLPEGLRARLPVVYQTTKDEKGREVLASIQVVSPTAPGVLALGTIPQRPGDNPEPNTSQSGHVEFLDPGTIYSVNAIPFGGFARMLGEEDPTFPGSLASKSKKTRIAVLAAGAGMNMLTAILFFALALRLGAPAVADPPNATISSVAPGSPAEQAGLQPGDLVLKADGQPILAIEDLQDYIQAHLGEPVVLTVQRADQELQLTATSRADPPQGEGPMGIILAPRTTVKQYSWPEALWLGIKQTMAYIVLILTIPVQIIRGLLPADLARPVGPVGVGRLVGDAVQYSLASGWWFPVMQIMGTLSVALAVTNLLPLPALDGGRILFVILEGIRGRRVDPAKEGMVHLIGMLLLVALMLVITWQDLVSPLPSMDWSSLF